MKAQRISKRLMMFVPGLLVAGLAQATIIYKDTFSTDGQLSGRAVETGSGTWVADGTNLTTSGGVALPGAVVAGKDAALAFAPQSGMVYTLSADVSISAGATWLAVGFIVNTNAVLAGNELFYELIDSPAPWAYIQTNGAVAALTGPKGTGFAGFPGKGTNGTIKIVLDTTGANWVSTWYFNNVALRTNTYTGALTDINYVGFGTGGALTGTVDHFKLDAEYQKRLSLIVLSTP
jgi:hypothetical protein